MSDDADQANDLAERERAASVARLKAPAAPLDLADCVACGEPIPPLRRQLIPNAIRCTGCQADHERNAA
ncbi:MAG TPA: TraR/DksA C4-type zinc finger protein [Kaistia sp.]|nr:TraR/DksA C4-type zinc finger protein [Kaistia sp.]